MKTILKLILTAVAIYAISNLLPGVTVTDLNAALIVAIVLSLLNLFIKPIIIFLTFPITLITFGLFLFVINTIIILIADYFVDGLQINSFWTALIFSLLLSVAQSILYSFLKESSKSK